MGETCLGIHAEDLGPKCDWILPMANLHVCNRDHREATEKRRHNKSTTQGCKPTPEPIADDRDQHQQRKL